MPLRSRWPTPPILWRLAGALALGAALLGAAAQDAPPALPTAEAIQARLDALEGSDVEHRGEVADAYAKALEALDRARQAELRTAELERRTREAPALLAAIREELALPAQAQAPASAALSPDELRRALDQSEADRQAAQGALDELERDAERRAERAAALPDELARARQEAAQLEESLRAAADGDALSEARRALLGARLAAERRQVAALEAESTCLEAERELVALRVQRGKRRVQRAAELAASWQERVSQERKRRAEADAREAGRTRREITARFPTLAALAERNEELASLRSGAEGVPARIDAARAELERLEDARKDVAERLRSTARKVAAAGLDQVTGALLRREYERLPVEARLRAERSALRTELSRVQLLLVGVEEDTPAEGVPQAGLARVMDELAREQPGAGADEAAALARELVATQDGLRQELTAELGRLESLLLEEEQAHARLASSVRAYRDYIEERILWVRSTSGSLVPDLSQASEATRWLVGSADWSRGLRMLTTSPGADWRQGLLALSLLVLTLALHARARRVVQRMSDMARSYRTDRFVLTLRALGTTSVLAAPASLALWLAGAVLVAPPEQVDVVRTVGEAAITLAPICFALRLLQEIARSKRLGETHFRWPAEAMRSLRRELRWFVPVVLPLLLVVLVFRERAHAPWSASAGRLAFAGYAIALAALAFRLFHREAALLSTRMERRRGLLARTHVLWFGLAVGLPLVLLGLSVAGYHYTALQLEQRLRASAWLVLVLVLVDALLERWLFLTRRRLAVEQARQRALARAEKAEADEAARESGTPALDEDAVDIPAMDAQTRQLFGTALVVLALSGLYLIWSGVFPALRALERVHLWPRVEVVEAAAPDPERMLDAGAPAAATPGEDAAAAEHVVSLADAGIALVLLVLMTLAARNVPGLLEFAVLQHMPIDSGVRFAATTLTRYLILIVGTSAAFAAVGIGWGTIQWLAAALTFGLAFGLQEIFANFVSGIIILLERPIRVGDIVTVDGIEGRVTRLRMRATTILDWDRRELLVPNKNFITGSVVNWTLTDPVTRLRIPVGIAYGSDTRRAHEILLEVARATQHVLDEPGPQALFLGFGESSLDFELRVFMRDRNLWPALTDQLHTGIDEAFRRAGIEISFPQRDLHIRSADGLAGLLRPDAKDAPAGLRDASGAGSGPA